MQSHRSSTLFLFSAVNLTLAWASGCSSRNEVQSVVANINDVDGGDKGTTTPGNPTSKQTVVSATPHAGSTAFTPVIAIPKKGSIALEVDANGAVLVTCGGQACACNDGIDNDADGVMDGFDAECTGPFDDDEGSFATGIPGDNRDPKWQDCFFDGNSGAGDDGCRYPTTCLDGTLDPSDAKCEVANSCQDSCAPLAPPGCDCFGCCDVSVKGTLHTVQISDSCSTEQINDTKACTPCVKSISCQNECNECELCLGKTLADLPAKCFVNTEPMPSVPPTPPSAPVPSTLTSAPPPSSSTAPPSASTPSTPPLTSDTPTNPPGNVCSAGAVCSNSSECAGGYCSLGCCRILLQ